MVDRNRGMKDENVPPATWIVLLKTEYRKKKARGE